MLKQKLKHTLKRYVSEIIYGVYNIVSYLVGPTVKVMSVDDTIDILVNGNDSLVRFGDGELKVIRGGDIEFQNANNKLSEELQDIIGYKYDHLLVSVQDIFEGVSQYVPKTQAFWKDHLLYYRRYYRTLCNTSRLYASTSFSRCYITILDKEKSAGWFEKIKKIWENKDVVVVEGELTYNGVGNDLFLGCKSIRRIICPSENAYDKINQIKKECLKNSKDILFLVTLGPAAKVLVRDLYLEGYRAIDIGQLDSEYDLFLAGEVEKIKVPKPIELVAEGGQYYSEVICRI